MSQYLQIRGAVSSGISTNTKVNNTDVNYKIQSDGGINRLALDYHPFESGLFFSAVNAF
ncbi:hypothetical protein MNBD_GAMMA03-2114 [hydrothermal vent metagenome]|uniref:Uncharacterized protein n=1 Tax=hydrothermal vent metagenome TaxID=652676 RepID=A0A3B0WE26_9ZZZZ